jgi:hypothetical protein
MRVYSLTRHLGICSCPHILSLNSQNRQQALWFDTLNSNWEVVGEPGKAVISLKRAVESADKNVVIDRDENLGQVDEYGCTALSFIDGGYDIV